MSKDLNFFNLSISKILTGEQSILDQARIRLLYYGLWIVFVAVSGLLVSVYFQHQVILTITAVIVLVLLVALFKYLTYRPNWQQVSHALLVMATLVNLNNVFVVFQKVDIITVQVVLLVILFSYYMFGQGWGLFYSLVNLIPVLVFLVWDNTSGYGLPMEPEKVDKSTIIISLFANFIIIIYIHSHLYNAFFNNIKALKEKGEEQARLNRQLDIAREKAEKSSQIKTEFLLTMSHEIRTPLNAIVGMSNLMLMGNPRPDQKDNLDVLKFSANNLQAIVNDVLDFNKIESGRVVFEQIRFKLPDLMESICGSQRLKAEEKSLKFHLRIDPALEQKILVGDPTRITQIIFNLVSNAIKFTSAGSIWVKVKCQKDDDDRITVGFAVRDTGIGIEKSNLASIFEPFTQESITTTRQYGGTGLGLAIVKRLLELQGVQMQVKSELGEGSEFSFSMEFPVSTDIIGKSLLANGSGILSSLKMLIAEDNPVNVLLMQKLLSKWNITPEIAENGERAIEMLQSGDFDIVLMDLQMPVLNGFDAAAGIRKLADPKKAGTPIIALTAASLLDVKEQVLSAGMNDYVAKPFRPEELMDKILTLVAPAE